MADAIPADDWAHSPRMCSLNAQECWVSCSQEHKQPSPSMFVDLQRQEE